MNYIPESSNGKEFIVVLGLIIVLSIIVGTCLL